MRVLIVEDDFISRKILHRMLSEFGECDVATDGQEAIDAFSLAWGQNQPYDLICLDIMMPEMDGQQVLKAIRHFEQDQKTPSSKAVKIFMTTALDSPHDVIEAYYRGGCDDYLVKPIDKNRLEQLLGQYRLFAS